MPERISHTLAPVFDAQSRILILGTMPSPRSRKAGFYYGHPQNRFWRVLADVFAEDVPPDNRSKEDFLLRHHIALWDVLQSCRIEGADDSSIRDPVPNDLSLILGKADIKAVFTTGQKATQLYMKHCLQRTGIMPEYLPSTSPANCARFSYEDLVRAYKVLEKFI
ncbi:MAG: DNA-deoxyinosine glycosylase [Eubacteriales bacterium]